MIIFTVAAEVRAMKIGSVNGCNLKKFVLIKALAGAPESSAPKLYVYLFCSSGTCAAYRVTGLPKLIGMIAAEFELVRRRVVRAPEAFRCNSYLLLNHNVNR
jgi:hypothetical protein